MWSSRSASRCPGGCRNGMPGHADLRLRPHQPLGHGRLGHQEGAGDLGRRQAGHQAQRQRDAGLGRERRVAAGEDQLETVVGHCVVLLGVLRVERRSGSASQRAAARAAPARGGGGRWRRCRPWRRSSRAASPGTPSAGQRAAARPNASCTDSSARSASPKRRMSAATARPQCSRNAVGGRLGARLPLHQWPHLDRPVPGRRHAARRPRSRRRSTRTRPRSSRPAAPWSRRTGRR